MIHRFGITAAVTVTLALFAPVGAAHPAIDAFTAWCFKAGQTPERARANMERSAGDPLPFELTFWDRSLAAAPGTPAHAERRCKVSFDGDHRAMAVQDVTAKMAQPPVFGTPISLPDPYEVTPGTAFLEARELLRKRVAVVHIGQQQGSTFIQVDRLPAGMGLAK